MAGASFMALLAKGASGGDPLFSSVVLLAHFDGANGSTTFTDSSSKNRTLTAVGDAALTTSSPLRGTASLSLAGAGAVTMASSADFTLSGDFCIELMINSTTTSLESGVQRTLIQLGSFNTASSICLTFYSGGASSNVGVFTDSQIINGTIPAADGSTHHIALDRSGTNLKLWVDGVQSGSTATNSVNYNNGATNTSFIGNSSSGGHVVGKIDEVRITTASRYQSAFTPPPTAFPDS